MPNFKILIQGLNVRPRQGYFGYSSVILIQDDGKNILFDTGSYGVRSILIDLLKKMTIDIVFISHLHFDHAANIDLFKNIPIYVNKKEIDYLNIEKSSFNPNTFTHAKYLLKDLNIYAFKKEENISTNIKIKFTPGHTIGHSSLEFKNHNKRIIILGDAIKSYKEYTSHKNNHFCYNIQKYRQTKSFLNNEYDILIPGHDRIIKKYIRHKPVNIKLTNF